jgi:hypothetical protein
VIRTVVSRAFALFAAAVLASSCADAPAPVVRGEGSLSPAAPAPFTITCTRDGGTELSAMQVEATPDGVHAHVANRSGEPASLNGLGTDVDPGSSDIVTATPPGEVDVACWPFSGHDGPEPDTTTLEILDPNAYFRSSELECEGDLAWSQDNDFVAGATGTPGQPIDIARDRVRGLEPSDELVGVGYAEREGAAAVAIVRDGATIGVVSFTRADDGGWLLSGGSGCDDADVRF